MKINLLTTVKNEEKNIGRLLKHASEWADNIFIYDDGSVDNTIEIASGYDKVRYIYENEDRGIIRTEGRDRQILLDISVEKSDAEWSIFLDADEVFENSIIDELPKMMENDEVDLYYFHLINFWRSTTHYRVDELWNKNYAGKMFRNFDNMKMYQIDNHSPQFPENLGVSIKPTQGERSKISKVKILHSGFINYADVAEKAYIYWLKDPLRIDNSGNYHGGHVYYERMIDENGLRLERYKP